MKYQPRSSHSPPFPLLGLLFCLQNTRHHTHTHTSSTHPPLFSSLLLPGSFSIICLSDACCGRIRADTPVPAATRGCHQHLNIFSLRYFPPSLPCVHAAALSLLTRNTEKMTNKGRREMMEKTERALLHLGIIPAFPSPLVFSTPPSPPHL